MRKLIFTFFVVVLILFSIKGITKAATFNVSSASDLATALSTAQGNGDNDTINIQTGTYYGNFTFTGTDNRSLTIIGANKDTTILNGNGNDMVLYIDNTAGTHVTVQNLTFTNGDSTSATGLAGGLYVATSTGSVSITNCIFNGNHSFIGGGAMATTDSGAITISHNTFSNNSLVPSFIYAGGGAFILTNSGLITVENNIFTNNIGAGIGGGALIISGNGIVNCINNVFSNNQSDLDGSGVELSIDTGIINFINNTITNNQADNEGGGAYLYFGDSAGTMNLYNNIIWGNTAIAGDDILLEGSGTLNLYNNDFHDMDTSDFSGTLHQGDNLDTDPSFVSTTDLHLQASSPVIDQGYNSAPSIPTLDLDGNQRIVDGDGDGNAIVDMGAYEYQLGPTPTDIDGIYKDVGYTHHLDIYVQNYATGTLIIYTFDTEYIGVFWDDNVVGGIFEGSPVNPTVNQTVEFNFNTNTFTINDLSTATSSTYNVEKFASVSSVRSTDGIYKGNDPSLNLNIYMQTYDNGGTLLLYTFDTLTMVASWDSAIEGDIFDGMKVNPSLAERARFDFSTNTLTIVPDTGTPTDYGTHLWEQAIH